MRRRRYIKGTNTVEYVGKADCHISVRLPKKAYSIIESYTGRNFSDKLVNFILDHGNIPK